MTDKQKDYIAQLSGCHERLGIPATLLQEALAGQYPQPLCEEALVLESVGTDVFGRKQRLTPAAAKAWAEMRQAAESEGVELQLVSAYRGIDYQSDLISRKLAAGQSLESILRVSAAPGFSEHHTGRAVDVTTSGVKPLEVEFESSNCFRWLEKRAGHFGFIMSYPRGNPFQIDYEPWHWCFVEKL